MEKMARLALPDGLVTITRKPFPRVAFPRSSIPRVSFPRKYPPAQRGRARLLESTSNIGYAIRG